MSVTITRAWLAALVLKAEQTCPKSLREDYTWLLDCGRDMGEPGAWVELVPGLQVLVCPGRGSIPANKQWILLFYPRVKHWLDPKWRPVVYAPWWES